MNSNSLQLSTPATGLKGTKPFYFAIIDGDHRICFVNSDFFAGSQRSCMPIVNAVTPSASDGDNRSLFKQAFIACMQKEQAPIVEVLMRESCDKWVNWEFHCLEGMGQVLGRLSHKSSVKKTEAELEKVMRDVRVNAETQERNRIAHELHDNVSQMLGSVQLYLNCLNRDNPDFELIKSRVEEITAQAIEEVRCLSHNKVTPDLEKRGLIEGIEQLVEDLRHTHRFEISFLYAGMLAIEKQDIQLKLTLFRIIQEQVWNICKYSKASCVQIGLRGDIDNIQLEINDNGVGFDPKAVRRGIGLSHIRERVSQYQGKTELNAAPGKGCKLAVTIPIEIR